MTGDVPVDEPRDGTEADAALPGAEETSDAELADVLAFPVSGEIFGDPRGGDRWMRATWHPESDVVVLSLWRSATCVGTMRVARGDVPGLVSLLVGGLAGPAAAPEPRAAAEPATSDTG